MQTGTVVRFSRDIGFIETDIKGKDLFFHYSGIRGTGYRKVDEGDRVGFEVEIGPKGSPQATDVHVIDPTEVNGNIA